MADFRRVLSTVCSVGLALVFAGCSFSTTDFTKCGSDAVCRGEFGLGFVCTSDGFCEGSERPARCRSRDTFPPGLYDDPEASRDRIIFGSLMDRSVTTKEARENSALIAVKLANDEGGLPDGREFGLVFCSIEENDSIDDMTLDEAAISSARYLAESLGVPAIFGPSGSRTTEAVFRDLVTESGHDLVVISPSATSPSITDIDGAVSDENPGRLWRTAPPDTLQGRVIAEDMRLGDDGVLGSGRIQEVVNVAIIYEGDSYGRGLQQVFRSTFIEFGGPVPAESEYSTDSSRTAAITEVGLSAATDVLFISSDANEVITFLNAVEGDANYDTKNIFLPDSGANASVVETVGAGLRPRIRGTRPAPLDAGSTVFSFFGNAYRSEFDGDSPDSFSFVAHSYDALWMLIYGSVWAVSVEGEISPENIARGLRQLSAGDSVQILSSTFNLVRERLGSGQSIDIEGASGALDFDPATEETSGPIQTWQIGGDGMVEGIETFDPL